jgi:hypothetical protein
MNRSEAGIRFALQIGEVRVVAELPPRSIATCLCHKAR